AGEYSRSNFDIRDRFVLGAIWNPNYYHGESKVLGYLANGFTISPLIGASSGAPFTPTVSGSAPSQTVNGVTYVAPQGASGSLADGGTTRVPFLGANSFQMPRTVNVDLRIAKEFKVWESWKLTLSGDAFNLFNHVNVTGVNTQMFSISGNNLNYQTTFGSATSSSNTLTAQRQIQVGIRLDF
ncbi:MAG: TonB-dependent receptor, partial [Candidatus Acidiferrales bacterium]